MWFVGHGFVSGFRSDFQNLAFGDLIYLNSLGLNPRGIGNAHGSFYELVYGIGWVAAIAVTLWFFWLVLAMGRTCLQTRLEEDSASSMWTVWALLIAVGVFNLTKSDAILPPGQQFGVLMCVLGMALGVHLRNRFNKGL